MIDERVKETRKTGNNSYERDAGHVTILYTYFTPVAIFDKREDVLYVGDHKWSHSTKCYTTKFRKIVNAEEEIEVGSIELELATLGYIADRLKAGVKGDNPDDIEFPFSSLTEEEDEATNDPISKAAAVAQESGDAITITVGSQKIIIPRTTL